MRRGFSISNFTSRLQLALGFLVGWERVWVSHGITSEGRGGGGSGDEGGRKRRISIAGDIEIVSQSFTGQISLSPSCFLGKIYESSQTEATDKAALFFFFFLGKEIEPKRITV